MFIFAELQLEVSIDELSNNFKILRYTIEKDKLMLNIGNGVKTCEIEHNFPVLANTGKPNFPTWLDIVFSRGM